MFDYVDTVEKKRFLEYKLKTDTLFFTRFFFKTQYGRKFIVGDHHRIISAALSRILRGELTKLIINMPPRYGKTELVVKAFMAQGLAINPKAKFIHTSYSDSLALDNSQAVKDLVKSEEYQFFFPVEVRKDIDSKKKWNTSEGGGIYSTSAGGQITGFGAGLVDEDEDGLESFLSCFDVLSKFGGAFIIDDPLKPEDALSMIKRDLVNQRFNTTFRSRANSRKTPFIIVAQRLHDNDLPGFLMQLEPNEWEVLSLPALKPDNTPLWPFKHTTEELLHLNKINHYAFQTQYQQKCSMIQSGGEFLKSFKMDKHLKTISYEPSQALHLCVDNNRYPYIAQSVWQIDGKRIKQIHEVPGIDPNNTATKAAEIFCNWAKSINYQNVVFVYGDQTTTHGNTIDDEKRSFFDKYCEVIRKSFPISIRMPSCNPLVAISGEFVNDILENNYDGLSIEISDTCQISANDYIMTKQDSEGGILKKRTKDTKTGISYEENGHFTDCLRYFICEAFKTEFSNWNPINSERVVFTQSGINYYKDKSFESINSEFNIGFINTSIDIGDKIAFPQVCILDGMAYVYNIVFMKDMEEIEHKCIFDINNKKISIVIIESNSAGSAFGKNIRSKCQMSDIRLKFTKGDRHTKILANAGFIKKHFVFKSDYESGSDYDIFMTNLRAYMRNGEEKNDSAAYSLTGLAEFIQREMSHLFN